MQSTFFPFSRLFPRIARWYAARCEGYIFLPIVKKNFESKPSEERLFEAADSSTGVCDYLAPAEPRKSLSSIAVAMKEPAPASAAILQLPARPVRMLRTSNAEPSGRFALVGRMADVCAELDRLAARERHCL